jgi:hypothetical protein
MANNNVDLAVFNYEEEFKKDCNSKEYKYIEGYLEPTDRTIAIGDIHGDLDVAIKTLELAKCIKEEKIKNDNCITVIYKDGTKKYYIWIGEKTRVVQVGDQVDRCRPYDMMCEIAIIDKDEASDIKILNLYTDIDKKAQEVGGRVISILGNHELMNVSGNMNYVSFMGLAQFYNEVNDQNQVNLAEINNINDIDERLKIASIGKKERQKAFSNVDKSNRKQELNKFLACTRTSAIIIGKLLFVHGGMVEQIANAYKISHLNLIVRKWLLGKKLDKGVLLTDNEKKNAKNISFDIEQRIYDLISSKKSIFWDRSLGSLPSDDEGNNNNCNIGNVLEKLNIDGIIVGHTPQMKNDKGINSACNRKVWRVDIGASSAFDQFRNGYRKKIQVLEITYDEKKNCIFKVLE